MSIELSTRLYDASLEYVAGKIRLAVALQAQIADHETRINALEAGGSGVPTSRTLTASTGLTGGGDLSANRSFAVAFGTSSSTACVGNDSRLSDSRTPTAHATSHKNGGSDAIKLDELAAPTDITTLNVTTSAHGLTPKLPNDATKYLDGTGAYSVPAGAGASTSNPYLAVPAGSFGTSDEFGSDTFLSGAWTIWNATANVSVTTRVGDVNAYANTLTSSQYNSTLVGSVLYFQFQKGSDIYVFKARTAGDCVITGRFFTTTNSATSYLYVGAFANGGSGHPPGATFNLAGWDSGNVAHYASGGGNTASDPGHHDIGAVKIVSTAAVAWHLNSNSGRTKSWGSLSGSGADYMGIRCSADDVGSDNVTIWGVDFIRQLPATNWLF